MSGFKSIVVDLDGTLCNDGHRAHLAKQGLWGEYHEALDGDVPFADVMYLLHNIADRAEICILTARPFKYIRQTEIWLDSYGIHPDAVLMRPNNDYSKSEILKPRLLEDFFGSKELVLRDVIFVLEDREKLVEMWRNYGLNCWQIRTGSH